MFLSVVFTLTVTSFSLSRRRARKLPSSNETPIDGITGLMPPVGGP